MFLKMNGDYYELIKNKKFAEIYWTQNMIFQDGNYYRKNGNT